MEVTDLPPEVELNQDVPVQDYGEHRAGLWIRHHLLSRSTLFEPEEGPGGPTLETSDDSRHSIIVPQDQTGETIQFKDDWIKSEPNCRVNGVPSWTGST